MTSSDPTLLVPLTLLSKVQAARYVVVACLTTCIYDWFISISDEYDMIYHAERRGRRYLLDCLYFIVRICPIVFLVSTLCMSGPDVLSFKTLALVIACNNVFMMPGTTALFFVRLRAVYMFNTYVIVFFGCCWLVVLGVFIFESVEGAKRCLSSTLAECFVIRYIDAYGYIALVIYDTLMYFAISFHLASQTPSDRWQDRLKSFVTGSKLGWLSKVMLQSGQLYYFVMVSFAMTTVLCLFCMPEGSMTKGLVVPLNISVASLMSCRVFRELKLGFYGRSTDDDTLSRIVFRDIDQQNGGQGLAPQVRSDHTGHWRGDVEVYDGGPGFELRDYSRFPYQLPT